MPATPASKTDHRLRALRFADALDDADLSIDRERVTLAIYGDLCEVDARAAAVWTSLHLARDQDQRLAGMGDGALVRAALAAIDAGAEV